MTPPEPAVAAPKKLMTADEFWDFVNRPENANRSFELHRGEVVEMSPPRHPHGRVMIRIGTILERYGEESGHGYPIGGDAGVVLEEDPDTVVGPGVAFFSGHPEFTDLDPKWPDTLPLLVVEILSTNDNPSKVIAKIRDYLRNGTRLVWLVDYEEQTASVFRPDRTPDVLQRSDEIRGGDELPGFVCRVSEFFRMPTKSAVPQPSAQDPPPNPPAA